MRPSKVADSVRIRTLLNRKGIETGCPLPFKRLKKSATREATQLRVCARPNVGLCAMPCGKLESGQCSLLKSAAEAQVADHTVKP